MPWRQPVPSHTFAFVPLILRSDSHFAQVRVHNVSFFERWLPFEKAEEKLNEVSKSRQRKWPRLTSTLCIPDDSSSSETPFNCGEPVRLRVVALFFVVETESSSSENGLFLDSAISWAERLARTSKSRQTEFKLRLITKDGTILHTRLSEC